MIQPVILCGGDGTRLWPASRRALPKQFMPLNGSSLYKGTLSRAAKLQGAASPLVICNHELRFWAAAQAEEAVGAKGEIILEPAGRNTAPAVAIAALHTRGQDPILLVLPSDHHFGDDVPLARAVERGLAAAQSGSLVTFGIVPSKPETGYGYIRAGGECDGGVHAVEEFVEKPDSQKAEEFFRSGLYFWNSGMFMFRASVYLKELEKYAPEILEACARAYEKKTSDLDFLRLDEEAFKACPADSIDYAVMEHTWKAVMVPMDGEWSDLGSWESLYTLGERDDAGNSVTGDVLALESSGSYIMAQSRLVAALGLENMLVVETPDAVMIAPKNRSQEVKKIVARLREEGRPEVEQHRVAFRPWGSYEEISRGDRFQVKRIIVTPGQRLSLQKHYHRAEHWVVVKGTALITTDGEERILSEDQSSYIPIGAVHRLENPGKVPLELIEIQTGSYLGEDDIIRYDDIYNR